MGRKDNTEVIQLLRNDVTPSAHLPKDFYTVAHIEQVESDNRYNCDLPGSDGVFSAIHNPRGTQGI